MGRGVTPAWCHLEETQQLLKKGRPLPPGWSSSTSEKELLWAGFSGGEGAPHRPISALDPPQPQQRGTCGGTDMAPPAPLPPVRDPAPRAPLCTFQGTTCILRFAAGPAVLSFPRGAQGEALCLPGPLSGSHRPRLARVRTGPPGGDEGGVR